MAGKRTEIIYTAKKLRSKRKTSAPGFLVKKTLETIGKPFYWIIYYLFFLIIRLINWGWRILERPRKINIVNWLKKQKFPKIKFPKIKIPHLQFPSKKVIFTTFSILFLSSTFYLLLFTLTNLPNPNQLQTRTPVLTTKIYDRNGNLLYKIYRNQNRTLIKLNDLPLHLIQATIAIEDAEFYQHHGFSPKGIFRAAIKNLKGDKLYGGSTITQQLVKNTLLSPKRTLTRKIKELILAILVESKFTKEEILQMYLNEVNYGGTAYGIEEAAQTYFGKSAKDLTLAEAALLAGLPASPTRFSPFGAHPELAKERQKLVLRRMREEGFITSYEEEEAIKAPLVFISQKKNIKAPHFVMYIKDLLVQKYGEQMVEEGGLEVKTSLDLEIQKYSQNVVSQEIKKLRSLKINNGAALVTKPSTGEILAMLGSADYFDLQNDGNVNVCLRPRQPGSAIKPVMYSLALENGFTPATIIPDTPITYQIPGQPPYSPKNYDNKFHGNVPLRIALASSYNVPAVKVLASLGVDKMIRRGQEMGITTWNDPSRFGLSLTLGGGEVKMIDLAVVYGVLANMGKKVELNPILEVKNYKGEIIETLKSPITNENFQILDPKVAFLLNDILSDNNARAPAFGYNSWLNIPNHPSVAVKTGTTQNLRDNWAVGYTPDFLVAVWVGNNDNKPMSYVASGITGASPIWHKIMSYLLKDIPDKKWEPPEGIIKVKICGKEEYFIAGTEKKVTCPPSPTPTPFL